MINSYKGLTGRYLKANKKRSILTIIGIALSVALIASIGFFLKGIQTAEVEQYKNMSGSWHVQFNKVDKTLVSRITNNPKVSRSGLLCTQPDIQLAKGVVLTPKIGSDKAIELLPYKIKDGRFPENKNELAAEKWELKYIKKDIKIGDNVTLNDTKYKLVGILDDNAFDQLQNKGVLLSKSNDIDASKASLLVEVSSKSNLKNTINELNTLADKTTISYNSYVIDVQGGGNDSASKAMFTVVGVIIAIIVIATIAVIYNSFQISVVERIKQFGLLRAVGLTPRQLRQMVLKEATILAFIAIPIGLIWGIIAIYGINFSFKLIGADTIMPLEISIAPDVLLISTAVGIVSVYFSALLPAFFAAKTSPLVAINNRTSISKEKIKRRKNRIARTILGFEGDLAAKNIKRNKKRYRITVFSIVISVFLFITFKSFMDMVINVNGTPDETSNIHFRISQKINNKQPNNYKNINNDIIDNVSKLDTVNKVYKLYSSLHFKQYFNKNQEVTQIKDSKNFYKTEKLDGQEKATLDQGFISIYDETSMETSKKYLESGNIDISKLNNENGVILVNAGTVKNGGRTYNGPILNMKIGDEIQLKNTDGTDTSVKKVKVLAILKQDPFGFGGRIKGAHLITTETVAKKLTDSQNIKQIGLSIQLKDIKQEDKAKTQLENIIQDDPTLTILNYIDQNKQQKSIMLMIEILVYGFVIVISLISSINIINTLTTNVILRKREFAALRAIGLTQKQLKKMITLEGLLYGVEGTLFGSILASGCSYLIYISMRDIQDFPWSIPWISIAIASVAALLIGYLSVLSPLRRINKENIIETIRQDA